MHLTLFAAFLIAPLSAPAQGTPVLTVEDAVRVALDNHPRLLTAAHDAKAAAAGVRSARALTSPNAFVAAAFVTGR